MNQQVIGKGRITDIPLMQQLFTLAVRQNRQIPQRCLWSLFQRIDQLMHHTLHVATDTLGTDLRFSHHGQIEAFAQVIHRQGQRVVGALLSRQRLDTFPGRATGSTGTVFQMPVIEQ
ncbi:hypothetical protein PSCICJ_04200 [Pseudomonas cichorii]|nr:hypothetical protein PSCICJ_04200 [Pseudomonas cichorii]